jgi:hypothetical protein
MQIGSLVLSGNAQLDLSSGGNKVVRCTALQIDTPGGSTIDLADNSMIVDYAGASAITTVRNAITNAYNAGNWNNPGIRSFLANAGETAVGYAEASDLFSVFPAMFAGESVDSSSVLVVFTRYGDANLDRIVNLQDFNRLAANFGQSGTDWSRGDFNFDGITNLQDFNKLAGNFGMSAAAAGPSAQDWADLASAVPEPSAAVLSAICGVISLRHRRRRGARLCHNSL